MKNFITFSLFIFVLGISSQVLAAGQMINIAVNGLVCDFCARAVEKVFSREESVAGIEVDLSTKNITLRLKEGAEMDDARIETLVRDSGYDLQNITRVEDVQDE